MTDFNKILEKAREIEKKMKESQDNLKKIEVDGVSGGDVVKITLNGDGEMINILLSDKVLKEDKDIIQDLIINCTDKKFDDFAGGKTNDEDLRNILNI